MGERAPAGLENPAGETDAAILRSLSPGWVDHAKLTGRVQNDKWVKKLQQQIAELRKRPLPDPATARQLWKAVQVALAAYLPVRFAEQYRLMEIRKVQEKIRRRGLTIRHRMMEQRVNTLRGTVGLHHLKKLGVVGVRRRSKSRVRCQPLVATAASPPLPSA